MAASRSSCIALLVVDDIPDLPRCERTIVHTIPSFIIQYTSVATPFGYKVTFSPVPLGPIPWAYRAEQEAMEVTSGTLDVVEVAEETSESVTGAGGPDTLVGTPITLPAEASLRIHIPRLTIRSAPVVLPSIFAFAFILNM